MSSREMPGGSALDVMRMDELAARLARRLVRGDAPGAVRLLHLVRRRLPNCADHVEIRAEMILEEWERAELEQGGAA